MTLVSYRRKYSTGICDNCGAPIMAASMMDGRTFLFDPEPMALGGYLVLGLTRLVHPLYVGENAKNNPRFRRHRCLSLKFRART